MRETEREIERERESEREFSFALFSVFVVRCVAVVCSHAARTCQSCTLFSADVFTGSLCSTCLVIVGDG